MLLNKHNKPQMVQRPMPKPEPKASRGDNKICIVIDPDNLKDIEAHYISKQSD